MSSISCFISVFISKIRIQILIQIWKSIFLNLEIINRGGQVIKTASIKTLSKAGVFSQAPRLTY